MNVFATVLTYAAPSANYRGESEENRTVIQKVTQGRHEYAVISPEAMRNALRETLRAYGLPSNRQRIEPTAGGSADGETDADDKAQPMVKFADYPDPAKYVDDFLFGYLLAVKGADLKKLRAAKGREFPLKRDSILRMNLAKALEPYRHDAIFTQSPQNSKDSPWRNADSSALLHRETTVTAFQYPFAINLDDCRLDDPEHGSDFRKWLVALLRAISELNNVAGNHARSYFEMAPASIVVRLTNSLVAGYDTYGFRPDGTFPEVVEGILKNDYPGSEFLLGGMLVRSVLDEATRKGLEAKGARLFRMSNQVLDAVARQACDQGFLPEGGGEPCSDSA